MSQFPTRDGERKENVIQQVAAESDREGGTEKERELLKESADMGDLRRCNEDSMSGKENWIKEWRGREVEDEMKAKTSLEGRQGAWRGETHGSATT